jgi:hydroxyacylglutathione hydrolase
MPADVSGGGEMTGAFNTASGTFTSVAIRSESGTEIIQLHTPGLGDNTYALRSGGEVVVVDPQRDLDRIEAMLRHTGGRLVAVLETHVHNDYVSGGPALARRHGAQYGLPADSGYGAEHRPLTDADEVVVGAVRLRALATPGHTPHHTSYAVVEAGDVRAVFTGGCVMVGACGRTDLISEDLTETLTRQQYRSAQRIGRYADPTAVAPTHGAGSFCAASAADADTWSTVGRERTRNPAFLARDEDDFVRSQLAALLAYPTYYTQMADLNRQGLGGWEAHPPRLLSPDELVALVDAGTTLVDGRPRHDFAAAHIPGSVNIELDPAFATYVGWLFPYNTPLALILGPDQLPTEALRQCARIGIETIQGVLDGGIDSWAATGRPVGSYPTTDIKGLRSAMDTGDDLRVLDVRQPLEWSAGHIPGAVHMHIADLPARVDELRGSQSPVYIYCRTGHRTAMAASLLARAGLAPVLVDGGFPDWEDLGLPVEQDR